MKRKWCSQTGVLVGLAVGLCALWAGAAPVGLCGDLITGSWSSSFSAGEGGIVACATSTCYEHMNGTPAWLLCSDGPNLIWNCYGGWFIGAAAGAGTTTHGTGAGTAGCWGSLAPWFCSNLSDAAFY